MEAIRTFSEILAKAEALEPVTVAVAAADDREVLEAVADAKKRQIADFRLFGDRNKIRAIADEIGLSLNPDMVTDQPNPALASREAVQAVREGQADVVMKGMVQTADFLRAVLNKEAGLRGSGVLSHVATFEVPGYDRLIHVTDPALNIAPSLQEKVQIVQNVVRLCHSLDLAEPKVAVLGAVEVVNPNMQPTLDAAALAQMNRRGQIKGLSSTVRLRWTMPYRWKQPSTKELKARWRVVPMCFWSPILKRVTCSINPWSTLPAAKSVVWCWEPRYPLSSLRERIRTKPN